ncbi:MAG: hypothetical protein ACRDIX_05280 [Actinomycetota bacterium]
MPVRPLRSWVLAVAVAWGLLVADVAVAHNFQATSSVSISRKPTGVVKKGTRVRFFGKVSSSQLFCRQGRRVRLYRYGHGVVAKAVTNSEGRYSMRYRVRRTSRFSVIAKGKMEGVHPHRHVCYSATSRTLRVRTR